MQTRPLGRTGIEVSEVGFGAWQIGSGDGTWAPVDPTSARRLVGEALDAGITLFDTAPHYGRSEELLGDALCDRRNDVVLVSKFGHRSDGTRDFSVKGLEESLARSLKRLRTDTIDVLLLHNPPAEVYDGAHPVWDALESARAAGMIRHYGASLDFAAEAEACLRNAGSTVLEVLFNIFHQDARRAFPLLTQQGTGVIVKVPLDSGWLTGRFDAASRFAGVRARWTPERVAERAALVERIAWLAADGTALAHKAIAFVLSYDEVSCVIPGIRTRDQLRDNVAASGLRLADDQRERLERFWDDLTDGGAHPLPW